MPADPVDVALELKRLVTEYNAAFAARLRPLGLTTLQAEAILALDDLGPVRLKQLATHLVAESGHPSRLVSRLERDGLAVRGKGNGDVVAIELTARGRELAAAARGARDNVTAALAEAAGAQLDALLPVLRRTRVRLTRDRVSHQAG